MISVFHNLNQIIVPCIKLCHGRNGILSRTHIDHVHSQRRPLNIW